MMQGKIAAWVVSCFERLGIPSPVRRCKLHIVKWDVRTRLGISKLLCVLYVFIFVVFYSVRSKCCVGKLGRHNPRANNKPSLQRGIRIQRDRLFLSRHATPPSPLPAFWGSLGDSWEFLGSSWIPEIELHCSIVFLGNGRQGRAHKNEKGKTEERAKGPRWPRNLGESFLAQTFSQESRERPREMPSGQGLGSGLGLAKGCRASYRDGMGRRRFSPSANGGMG
jgi:hypothetical protein